MRALLDQICGLALASVIACGMCGCGGAISSSPASGGQDTISSPTTLSAVESNLYCTIMLKWGASTASDGVAGYKILRNNSVIGSTSNLTYNDTTALVSESYTYSVEAYDAAGSLSSPSTAMTVATGSTCTAAPSFRLGVIYTPNQSTFSIWSPDSANVSLNLNGALYPMSAIADTNGYTDVYSITLSGDLYLQTYNFEINGAISRDPYGVMVQPGTNNNIVMDPSLIPPSGGWAAAPTFTNRTDAVIYETHVRDFTNDASSGLTTSLRSTYEGMTEAGTTVNGAVGAPSTGIDHLVDMGITHIQLMPVFDFNSCNPTIVATDPNCYNWGYDPVNFNIPEERYSQTPDAPAARVLEFKTMIDSFHRRGIRVVMDVVYNHTADTTVFGNISSKYYLASDLTGTGNTLDGSQPMVARMIQDSLDYWVSQYHIDGFRFDLMGVFSLSTVEGWANYLNTTYPNNNLLLYGEPYVGISPDPNWPSQIGLSNIGTVASAHLGAFNIAYRGALKNTDDNGGGNTGFMFDQGTSDSFFGAYTPGTYFSGTTDGLGAISEGVVASPLASLPAVAQNAEFPAMFTASPEQSINYVDVHDNLCLADKVSAWAADNGQSANIALQTQLQQYAMGMILTSQGISFLYGGSEFQRTKQGNSNSYQSPDSVNDFNWNFLVANATTYNFVRGLISLRKAHPGLRFPSAASISSNVQSDQRSASLVVTEINTAANGDSWSKALVIFNSGATQNIALPGGAWTIAAQGSTVYSSPTVVVTGSVTAPSEALMVLYQ